MNWGSVAEFFAMGGYGFYVWGSYGVAFILLGVEVLAVLKRKRAIKRTTHVREAQLETTNSKLETAL